MRQAIFRSQMAFFLLYGIASGIAFNAYTAREVRKAEFAVAARMLVKMSPSNLTDYAYENE